jgi:cytochrome oxidase Cu insertion factor (SCO1/SenC/PrrC family)
MMKRRVALALGGVALSALAQQPPPPKTHLKVGDAAPAFTLAGINGKPVSLADYKGKGLVLAFFPAAFTGG